MRIVYYPDEQTVRKAIDADDPLLVLIAHDISEALVSNIDDSMEHVILMRQLNRSELDIDKYFRIVLNRAGADWTFVCPSNFKGIRDRNRRIEAFYNEGIDAISVATKALGYEVNVNIPVRYRRHFNSLSDQS